MALTRQILIILVFIFSAEWTYGSYRCLEVFSASKPTFESSADVAWRGLTDIQLYESSRRLRSPVPPPPLKTGRKYPTINMQWEYWILDRINSVHYNLTEATREDYRYVVRNGLLYHVSGFIAGDRNLDGTRVRRPTNLAFVMDRSGNLYMADNSSGFGLGGAYKHSTFLAGGAVAAVGEIKVYDGRIDHFNNSSGHYRPNKSLNESLMKELVAEGANFYVSELGSTPW